MFQWRTHRHIDHHLKFGFIVKGQHLEQYQTGGWQGHGYRNQHRHREAQQPAVACAYLWVQQGREHTHKHRLQQRTQATWRMGMGAGRRRGLHPDAGQPRRDHKGDGQRQQHAHAGVDGDGAHVRAHQARDKGHGQQRGNDGERGQDGGTAHFIHRAGDELRQGFVRKQLLVAVDVFHDDDSVIDQDANRKYQRKQRHAVERKAPGPGRKQRDGERQHHRHTHDGRFPAAQRQKHQEHDRGSSEQEFLNQLLRFGVGRFAVVAGLHHLHTVGHHGVAQLGYALHYRVGDVDGVFAGLFGDA